MLRSSLAWFVLLGAVTPCPASSWATALFDDPARDFGAVPRGPTLVHHYRLVNRTQSTVHISNVRVSCGCVAAQALDTTVAPGKETAILIHMDTRRFSNTKAVTIYVQFDQPQFDEVRLSVQANSRDDITVLPEGLAFGKIKRGTAPAQAVTVSFLGNGNAEVVKMRCDSNYVHLSCKEVRRSTSEVAYQLSAKLRSDAPPGKWYSDVWLLTNDASISKIRVPLTVEIEAPAPVNTPPTVSMGLMKSGSEVERKVILRGVRPFRITSINGTDDEVRVRESGSQSRTVHVLTVTLRPNSSGVLNRTLLIRTDMGKENDIRFQTRAHVVP